MAKNNIAIPAAIIAWPMLPGNLDWVALPPGSIRLAPLAGNHIGHPHPGAGEGAGLVERPP